MPRTEATGEQRALFAAALASAIHSPAALARKLDVTPQAVSDWARGKKEPTRSNVFAAEAALGLPPGALSHLLGYLPVGPLGDVERAITTDPRLTPRQREMLLAQYRTFASAGTRS